MKKTMEQYSVCKLAYTSRVINARPCFLDPVQELLRHRHLRLGGAQNPHLLRVNSGFCVPSTHN